MAITIAASAAVAFIAAKVAARPDRHSHPHAHPHPHASGQDPAAGTEVDLHDWMHDQLTISDSQEALLDPLEKNFAEQSAQHQQDIANAEKVLALTVRTAQRDSDAVDQALERLNNAHAQLRRLTLEHFFAMEEHLDPGQAERLRQWTHDSLLRQPTARP